MTDSIIFSGVRVGAGARLHRCVIDKNVDVPAGALLGADRASDAEHYTISDNGVVVVPKGFKIPNDRG